MGQGPVSSFESQVMDDSLAWNQFLTGTYPHNWRLRFDVDSLHAIAQLADRQNAKMSHCWLSKCRNVTLLTVKMPKCHIVDCQNAEMSHCWLSKCWPSKCRPSKCWLSKCWTSKCQLSKCQPSKMSTIKMPNIKMSTIKQKLLSGLYFGPKLGQLTYVG
jgi:hypothetical protein